MLGIGSQVLNALIKAPLAPLRLRARSATWLVVYLLLAGAILWLVARLILAYRGEILGALVDYIFPAGWHEAGEMLIKRFFAEQERAVITNAAIAGSLLVVQLTLFPVKEALSAALERDGKLVGEPPSEYPLWFQGWEEIKLALFFFAMQGSIFWIGYTDDAFRKQLATMLSYLYLFVSISADFIAPVLQRHRLRYSKILKTLIAHPIVTLGFGAVFAAPPLVAQAVVNANREWSLGLVLAVQFGAAVLAIAWAAMGGTVVGAALLGEARARSTSSMPVRALTWSLLLGLLLWNGYRFGAVARSLHHKSQILKCEYAIDWSSFDFERPSLGGLAAGLASDDVKIGLTFDVTITNPTGVDVEIEHNRIDIKQNSRSVATTSLPRLKVPAGQTVTSHIEFPLSIKPSQLTRLDELFSTKGWEATLWLEVARGFDFPVYLLSKT
jgi:hypothetical protein